MFLVRVGTLTIEWTNVDCNPRTSHSNTHRKKTRSTFHLILMRIGFQHIKVHRTQKKHDIQFYCLKCLQPTPLIKICLYIFPIIKGSMYHALHSTNLTHLTETHLGLICKRWFPRGIGDGINKKHKNNRGKWRFHLQHQLREPEHAQDGKGKVRWFRYIIHMSNVPNPYDIPLFWLVHRHPFMGLLLFWSWIIVIPIL